MHGSKDYIIHLSKRTVYSTTVSVPKYDAKPSIVSAYKVPNIKFNLLIFQKQIYQFHTQYVIPCKGQQWMTCKLFIRYEASQTDKIGTGSIYASLWTHNQLINGLSWL